MTERVEVVIFPDVKRLARERELRARAEKERKQMEAFNARLVRSRGKNGPVVKITCYDAEGNEVKSS